MIIADTREAASSLQSAQWHIGDGAIIELLRLFFLVVHVKSL